MVFNPDFLKKNHFITFTLDKMLITARKLAFLQPANEVWGKVMFFRPVCRSFCSRGRGVPVPLHAGIHPRVGTPPWAGTPSAHCMLGYGQQARGTHPTGMQSCYSVSLFLKITYQHEVNGTTDFFNYYAYLLARRHCHGYKRSK